MEFKIYDASTGCTPTTGSGCHLSWTEDWLVGSSEGGITFSSGTFEVNLGATCPFSGGSCESYTNTAINWNTYPLYLSLQIGNTSTCTISTNFTSNCGGDTEMKPYILLTSTPYSENSGELGGLTSAGFVQNQNSSPQSTTNFDISGTGQAAAFDAASASTLNLGTTTANALQIGSSTNSTSGVTISTAQNFTLNGVAGSVYAIGAATTTGSITIGGSSQTGAFTLQDNTALTLNTPNAQFSALSAGTRTINIAAQGTNVAGTNLTIQAGAAGAGASAFTGGALNLYGGNAGGTGNANGANVVLQGGNGTGSGVQGLVTSAATLFNSVSYSNGSSGNITQADIDNYSTISATATNPSLTFTVTSPTITTAGRIIYIANVGGTNAFTLAAAGLSSVTVNTGSTVTLLWNGSAWTNASTVPAGGGTTLQTSYAASGNGATAPQITLTSSNNTLNIQDANPTIGANILDVRATASRAIRRFFFFFLLSCTSFSYILAVSTPEIAAIKNACEAYPEHKEWFEAIKPRFVDLYAPFRSFNYYHPDQQGSASIKYVLPALTGKGYKGMDITDGLMASLEYSRVTFTMGISENERHRVYTALEEYCDLDTRGMIDILENLERL